jgi:hypothetical protein
MTSWSYSSYSTALQCLRKYKYLYIDKLSPPQASGDLAFGSAIHLALNAVLLGENGDEVFELYWEVEKTKPLEYSRYLWADLKDLGLNFISKFKRAHAKDFEPVFMEKRLYANYGNIALEGTVDFAGLYRGIPSIVDFKTTAWAYDKEKTDVALQLYLYSYLAEANGFQSTQLVYFPLVKGSGTIQKPLILTLSHDRRKKALDQLTEYVSMVNKQDSYPENWNSCIIGKSKCPFWNKCHGDKK